jgi:hypothetical protein
MEMKFVKRWKTKSINEPRVDIFPKTNKDEADRPRYADEPMPVKRYEEPKQDQRDDMTCKK